MLCETSSESVLCGSLNEKQREAVCLPSLHVLILAGAGSGKTRVLVHRLVWLLGHENLSPSRMLAVTFTNKAAREMRERMASLLGHSVDVRSMWVGTFHGLANRMIRRHADRLGLPNTFQVLDSEDQLRVIRRLSKEMQIDEKEYPPRLIQSRISHWKEEGMRAEEVASRVMVQDWNKDRVCADLYLAYEKWMKAHHALDFSELLLLSYELLESHPEVLAEYHARFRHILVDEFQDTNSIQYAWLKLLASGGAKVTAVGDDDQSIYGWRGAKVENLTRFRRDFDAVHLIRLEQNYRSTQVILHAANALISNNRGRMGKTLWTADEGGEKISVYAAFNEMDEARFLVGTLQKRLKTSPGLKRGDHAFLYRSNAQSRVFEEALIQAGLPYRIYGGLRFFERAEIKDTLAYLRLIENPDDNVAFERIINLPARGIGEQTLGFIREFANQTGQSYWVALGAIIREKRLTARALGALEAFMNLIHALGDEIEVLSLPLKIQLTTQKTGLALHYQKEHDERTARRLENLDELMTAAKQFEAEPPAEYSGSMLSAFLSHAALESADELSSEEKEDAVQLMTFHSAKGLEFKVVFMVGMEEEIFPSPFNKDDPSKLEEERRLCYVGMTRAMQKLYLSYAQVRQLHGESKYHRPSRFLKEIPEECLEYLSLRAKADQPVVGAAIPRYASASKVAPVASPSTPFSVGDKVQHPVFGRGVVINYEGKGEGLRVQVRFGSGDTKWLFAAQAKLEKV
jgi:DNA helicase-2/ATP-dependent DNA helicase PcrA